MPMTEDGYVQGDGWVAGIDFDPRDPEEMEIMRDVWDREKFDRTRQLERENEILRAVVNGQLTEGQRDEVDGACEAGASYAQAVCDVWNANKEL
ncbi:hypothetical protein J4U02_gp117 [Mycobacterium phage Aziz]|uniref:Uncharacterized protein n=1 Tax=Mycobacterium phage Aziz TaxID=2762281 RepID=A0A7G8LHS3_9CAUD|nr:hypothetical protein J4U02_gp117 [Mycobacterium phage Aziz]ASR75982.1 hypothetical protein SEA_GENEVAB15_161 [Mycobacterium phage GenevaB15]QNJ56795.1 hypothetical protein SEA_AZIZ_157 [Mycobacterium phage Aziz]